MFFIDQVCPKDIAYISEISESVFSNEPESAPDGFNNPEWYFNAATTGYLYKIIFNGELAGGFVVFRTGQFNFQLERIFILPEYQNLGLGKKAISYAIKRFPEGKVWYTDVKPSWEKYSLFLTGCGFFESGFAIGSSTRYIKLLNK